MNHTFQTHWIHTKDKATSLLSTGKNPRSTGIWGGSVVHDVVSVKRHTSTVKGQKVCRLLITAATGATYTVSCFMTEGDNP